MIRTRGLTKRFGSLTRRRRPRPRRRRGRRLRLPGRQRLGQDHHGPDAARAGAGHVGDGRAARPADAAGRRARCCRRSARWSRGRRRTGTCPGGPTCALLDASGPRPVARAADRRPGRRRRWSRSASAGSGRRPVKAYSLGMRQRLGLAARAAAPAAAAGPRRADQRPGPAGHPRDPRAARCGCNAAGTTIFLSSHLLAEVEQLCTRVGVLDRGRLVLQDAARRAAGARPAARCVRTPDVGAGASRCSTAGVEARDGDRLLVRDDRRGRAQRPARRRRRPGPGARARAALAGGRRARGTGAAGDRVEPAGWQGAPMIARRAGQAVPPAAHLGDDR